jgi:hypothetical protein
VEVASSSAGAPNKGPRSRLRRWWWKAGNKIHSSLNRHTELITGRLKTELQLIDGNYPEWYNIRQRYLPAELYAHHLRLGLSARVRIEVKGYMELFPSNHNVDGPKI